MSLGLDSAVVETLLDAEVENPQVKYLSLIEAETNKERAKTYANWVVNILVPLNREGSLIVTDGDNRLQIFKTVYDLYSTNKIHSNSAKAMLIELLKIGSLPGGFDKWAEEQGYLQISDELTLRQMVSEVISKNQKAAEDIKNGELKAIGFLIGQVMQMSAGKANPAVVKQMIESILKEEADAN